MLIGRLIMRLACSSWDLGLLYISSRGSQNGKLNAAQGRQIKTSADGEMFYGVYRTRIGDLFGAVTHAYRR